MLAIEIAKSPRSGKHASGSSLPNEIPIPSLEKTDLTVARRVRAAEFELRF